MLVMNTKDKKLLRIIAFFTLACLALSLSRYLYSGTIRHLYLPWNLFLAFLPLVFALKARNLKNKASFWVMFIIWLAFIPNAFYIVTDLIHLNPIEANYEGYQVGNYRYANEPNSPGVLFDAVLLFMYSSFGFLLGLISIELIQKKLIKLIKPRTAWLVIFGSLFLSGFAIYLGRHLRWNSWDAVININELMSDVLDIFIHPVANSEAWAVTFLFFFLGSSFYLLYRSLRTL